MRTAKYKQFWDNVLDKKCSSNNDEEAARKAIDYIISQDKFDPLTQEQWREMFRICNNPFPLAKWIIEEHYDIVAEGEGLLVQVCEGNAPLVKSMEDMKETISYIIENMPQERQEELWGTAFVLTCKNNNLYLIKWFLEQGVDVEYCYQGQNALEAARSNIQTEDGIEDTTIVDYLERNLHKKSDFEDVLKYYSRGCLYEPPKPPKEKINTLLTEAAKERAEFLLRDCPELLEEETSGEELHQYMEEYNWDDGLEVPYFIMQHPNCELATALLMFWLAEGDYIFEDDFEEMDFIDEVEFKYFLRMLHDRIVRGVYKVGTQSYQIPLNEKQKQYYRDKNVQEVFLTDLG